MKRLTLVMVALAALVLGYSPATYSATSVVGTLSIAADDCSGGLTGSYFQMWHSLGSNVMGFPGEGCSAVGGSSGTFALKGPAPAQGLKIGSYQYDDTNNPFGYLYTKIIDSFSFFGFGVWLNTSPVDYQTASPVLVPALVYDTCDSSGVCPLISGSTQTTAWNVDFGGPGNNFNQGSPKPDGTLPSLGVDGTQPVTGTLNSVTGATTMTWRSLIVGGGFAGFTGHWQLAGTIKCTDRHPVTSVVVSKRGIDVTVVGNVVTAAIRGNGTKLPICKGTSVTVLAGSGVTLSGSIPCTISGDSCSVGALNSTETVSATKTGVNGQLRVRLRPF